MLTSAFDFNVCVFLIAKFVFAFCIISFPQYCVSSNNNDKLEVQMSYKARKRLGITKIKC